MRIFISGSTGFIGANLTNTLAKQGHIVHALIRNPAKASNLVKDNVVLCKGDIMDRESLAKGMEGCDQVYHLAAFAKVWDKNPDTFERINIDGSLNIVEEGMKAGVKKFVITSTAGVMGPALNGEVDENSPKPSFYSTEYERTKAVAEEKLFELVKQGAPVTIVNPTRVYGPGLLSDSNAVTKLIDRYSKGKWRILPGDGSKMGNYVYVDDVVTGHILAMEKGQIGERYILGGTNATYSELFDTVASITGKSYKLIKFPVSMMMLVARMQMLKTQLTGLPPLITPPFVRRYLYDWNLSSDKAVNKLGYAITPLTQGVEKTISWIRENA